MKSGFVEEGRSWLPNQCRICRTIHAPTHDRAQWSVRGPTPDEISLFTALGAVPPNKQKKIASNTIRLGNHPGVARVTCSTVQYFLACNVSPTIQARRTRSMLPKSNCECDLLATTCSLHVLCNNGTVLYCCATVQVLHVQYCWS